MPYKLLISALILCFSSSGCVFLIPGAMAHIFGRKDPQEKTAEAKAVREKPVAKKKAARPDKRGRTLALKEITGSREDVFNTTVTILLDKGCYIVSSDYDSGLVVAEVQEPSYFELRVFLEPVNASRINVRLKARDKKGTINTPMTFSTLFDDIQAEVFRREFRRRKTVR